jgi:hypothetical protein
VGGDDVDEPLTPAPLVKQKRPVLSRLGSGAVLAAALTLAVPGVAHAQGFFTGKTLTAASWAAKSYSPISVGAMAGYGAIAGKSVADGALLFHFSTVHGSVATTPGTTISNVAVDGTADRNTTAPPTATLRPRYAPWPPRPRHATP